MPKGLLVEIIPATCDDVFDLLHDYERRLEWDTLLQDAHLCDGWTSAELHATSICTGHWYLGGIALKTKYVSFVPGSIAAVVMLNQPPFFGRFIATIRHREIEDSASSVEYRYDFEAKPTCLRWLLHPVMSCVFRWETRKRLRSLRRHFERGAR
ncbi:MAG: SRPBCC family protein [Planctomycetota bacterium]